MKEKYLNYIQACSHGNLNQVADNITQLSNKEKEFGFYQACSYGQLEVVKYLLSENRLSDTATNCSPMLIYGFMGACHKEGKKVMDYFLNDLKLEVLKLDPSIEFWLRENKLGRVLRRINVNNNKSTITIRKT